MSSLTIIVIFAISSTLSLLAFFLTTRLKKTTYNKLKKEVEMESMRKHIEKQIYNLNDRLILSEQRWKDVNHLLIGSTLEGGIRNAQPSYFSSFLKNNGIRENDLIINPKLIFLLTPFNDKFYDDYRVIQDFFTNKGFNCYRGDEFLIQGDIFPEMLKLIVSSRLIIANVNGRNPNVMYELGIAHALDKPVILISREPDKLPIDLKSKRFLIYSDYNQLLEQFENELTEIIF